MLGALHLLHSGILASVKANSLSIRALWSQPRVQRLVGIVVFGAFLVFVEVYFGWGRLLAPWGTLPLSQILAAVVLAFVSYWTRAMRLYDYFRPPRMAVASGIVPPATLVHPCTAEVPETHDSKDGGGRALPGANAEEQFSGRDEMQGAFGLYFKVMLQHNLLNNLLPMRTGEISFPVLMARHFGVPAVRSVPALFWFRLLDLHTLGACALVAGFMWDIPLMLALLLAWMVLPILLFWGSGRWQRLLHDQPGRIKELLKKALASLPQTSRAFWRAWAWTVITWVVKLGVFAWVLSLFMDVSGAGALMGTIAGDLTSVLPIHGVAGMGTYEAGVVAGLLPYGVTAQNALPAAVNLHLFLLGSTLIGGAFSLLMGGKKAHG